MKPGFLCLGVSLYVVVPFGGHRLVQVRPLSLSNIPNWSWPCRNTHVQVSNRNASLAHQGLAMEHLRPARGHWNRIDFLPHMPLLEGSIIYCTGLQTRVFVPVGMSKGFSAYYHMKYFLKVDLPESEYSQSVLLVPRHDAPGWQASGRPKKGVIEILVLQLKYKWLDKFFCKLGGFQFIALNKIGGGSNQIQIKEYLICPVIDLLKIFILRYNSHTMHSVGFHIFTELCTRHHYQF